MNADRMLTQMDCPDVTIPHRFGVIDKIQWQGGTQTLAPISS